MPSRFPAAARLSGLTEYYFSRKLAEIAQRRAAGESILNLGIGNPDLPPPPGVVTTLMATAQQAQANGYQSYRGVAAWREALQAWYADAYRVDLDDSEILPLAGSKEGIVHLALAYLEPGRAMLYPNPGYPAYPAAAQLAGGTALPYPLPELTETPDGWISRIEVAMGDADVRMLILNSPHMPTGQVIGREYLQALTAFAKTRELLLVSDNAYSFYAPEGPSSLLTVPGARDVAVELNSLSKSHHLPGWRLGVLVGRADVIAAALQVKSNLDSGQYLPVQQGAAVALAAPRDWHERRDAVIEARRTLGQNLLESLGCRVPPHQSGLFVWASLPEGQTDAESFCDELLDCAGVFVSPGTVFGSAGAGHLRLSLCADDETLRDALRRVKGLAALPV